MPQVSFCDPPAEAVGLTADQAERARYRIPVIDVDPEHHLLFAVDAGSDTISVLSVDGSHVRLDQVLSSGGEFPTSIAVRGNLVYVVNAGGAGSVSGFWIFGQHMVAIPGSTRSLGLDDTNPCRARRVP